MSGLVSWGEIDASGDVTTGANIDRPQTRSQQAVDARIKALAPTLVGFTPDVTAAAQAAVSGAVDALNLVPASRGILPTGSDLDDLWTTSQAGSWSLVSTNSYENLPAPLMGGSNLEVVAPRDDGLGSSQRVTTNAGATYQRSRRAEGLWAPWERVADLTDVPRSPSAEAILDLARSDGWLAVYDPGNAESRQMRLGRVYALADGLGNLPPAVSTAAKTTPFDPKFSTEGMGALPCMEFNTDGVEACLRTVEWPTAQKQPLFIMTVARDPSGTPYSGRFILDGVRTGERNAIAVSDYEGAPQGSFSAFAGTDIYLRDAPMDDRPHVLGVQYDSLTTRFFLDGSPQYFRVRTGNLADFKQPLGGLTIGGRYASRTTANQWNGFIGPVIIYAGVPEDAVRQRMERLLAGYVNAWVGADQIASPSAILKTAAGKIVYAKDADQPRVPASLTKVLTSYVARSRWLTDARLDDLVEIVESDDVGGVGSSPRLKVGDQVSYRDLLYMAMLPSHNAATRALARSIGNKLSGGGDGLTKFMAALNSQAQEWDWEGAIWYDPAGLDTRNRVTARQVADLMLRVAAEDPKLVEIMGAQTHTVAVHGASARELKIKHTIDKDGPVAFPEWLAGKTGTLQTLGSIAILTKKGSEPVKCVVTLRVKPKDQRLTDARNILDGLTWLPFSAGAAQTDVFAGQAIQNAGSATREALGELFASASEMENAALALEELTERVDESIPFVRLNAETDLDDLQTGLFYASSEVGDALGIPGKSSRFGMCIRSGHNTGSVGIQMIWAADSTPTTQYERRRWTSGWKEWVPTGGAQIAALEERIRALEARIR